MSCGIRLPSLFLLVCLTSLFAVQVTAGFSFPLSGPLNFTTGEGQVWQMVPSGEMDIPHPSFLVRTASPFTPGKDLLWITQFTGNPFDHGTISFVDDVSSVVDWSTVKFNKADASFVWPNYVSLLPAGAVSGIESALVVPDGFLVPGKSTGSIKLLILKSSIVDAGKVVEIAPEKKGYFYHYVEWIDMDADGDLDCLTARGTKPVVFGSAGGELVWLENPGTSFDVNEQWKLHVITEGPDFFFASKKGADGNLYVFAPQFFTAKLALYGISLSNGSLISSRDIDGSFGPGYCAVFADINGDGQEDLVASNHKGDGKGGIYAYEIPSNGDFLNGHYPKHTVNEGYPVRESGIGQAAPGFITLHQTTDKQGSRPFILVAGDGSESAYVLTPTGAQGSYSYAQSIEVAAGGTVGIIASIPRADGKWELVIPNYDKGKIFAVTLSPADE